MAANNNAPANPARQNRLRFLKWFLTATVVLALVVGVSVALRPPKPDGAPGAARVEVRFADVTDRAGIQFRHTSGARGKKLLPETMGAGVAVLDFDRDGRPDLFFVNSRPWPGDADAAAPLPAQALYRNRGDGTFEDVTAAVGLDVPLYGMGAAVGDFDNDGWPDLLVTAVGGNRLFRNASGTRFEDVTAIAGVGDTKWPNESAAEFARRAEPIPFPSSAAWLDYDGDGRLDLFVCYYLTWAPAFDLGVPAVLPGGRRAYVPPQQFTGAQCQLFRNVDGSRFENVTAAAGIQVTEPSAAGAPRPVGKALGAVVCDPDGDGWPDIVVANDTVRNFFFHNQPGSNGTRVFKESGLFAGIAYADGRPRGGMGVDAGEIAPGALAVVVANFTHEPNSLFQLQRTRPVLFSDVAGEVGLAGPSQRAMKFGALLFDFDRDGRLDLFTANGHLEPDIGVAQAGQTHAQTGQLFWNSGQHPEMFVPARGAGDKDPFPAMVGRGCAYLDFDGDGRLDLVATENNGRARLFRNETPDANNWVRFAFNGDGQRTNREALGATVTVHAGGGVQTRYITAAHGYLSQCEPVAYFGLGSALTVERVVVRWPNRDGQAQEWHNLSAGATYHLKENVPEAARADR